MIDGKVFKSPAKLLCRGLWRSRNRWKEKAIRLQETGREQLEQIRQLERRERELLAERDAARRDAAETQQRYEALLAAPLRDAALLGHQYSAALIALCIALSRIIGFRAVPEVLKLVTQALGVSLKIPSQSTVRNWACRNGVAILNEAVRGDNWIWMIDHSIQLGKMYVLVVLGIRPDDLPKDRPLERSDMTPLAVLPTFSKTKEEVGRQLCETAERLGIPLAVLSDAGSELHAGVRALEPLGFCGPHINDVKHKVANVLKKVLGDNERYQAFLGEVGRVRSAIQQTELDHFLPPRQKTKCRFMNFGALIDWASMALHHLDEAAASNTAASLRIKDKLGWLQEFREDLIAWQESRNLVGTIVTFAANHGVWDGATDKLESLLALCSCTTELSRELRASLTAIYQTNEDRLKAAGLNSCRLPCSTEILESAFGSFKAMQGNHYMGTFTSLLAAFAGLFSENLPEQIAKRFRATSNKDLQDWLSRSNLTNSTQSRRTAAYAAAKPQKTLSPTRF